MAQLTERDWRRLIEAIRRNKCILLIGPDIAFNPKGSHKHPLTLDLADKLAHLLPSNIQINKKDELARVAQIVYNNTGIDRYDLELEVNDFYKSFTGQTTPLYRDLAALPFSLCLTTAHDHFLLNAFLKTPGKTPHHDFYHFRKNRPFQSFDGTEKKPLIYHLFGDLQALDSLVLTETDLLEFLVNVVRSAPALPPYIASLLSDPQISFLFLGFGFQRWYTRVLLHVLQTYGHRNRSLALEGASFFEHPDREHNAIFFGQEHKVEFRQYSWSEFAANLRKRYKPEKSTTTESDLPIDAPKVFLCYDSRDREHVADVELRLHHLGINTWRDHQDLRGGEDWGRRIPRVIRKQADYMLVLQTPKMCELAKSFVHMEIFEALEQQKLFDEDEKFLIPTILIMSPGLSRLNHLHQRDLTELNGVERLASEIKNDFKRRKTRVMKS